MQYNTNLDSFLIYRHYFRDSFLGKPNDLRDAKCYSIVARISPSTTVTS